MHKGKNPPALADAEGLEACDGKHHTHISPAERRKPPHILSVFADAENFMKRRTFVLDRKRRGMPE